MGEQDADDEDLPPLEEEADEGSRMEVCFQEHLVWHCIFSPPVGLYVN